MSSARGIPKTGRKRLAAITGRGREVAVAATEVVNDARFGTRPLKHTQLRELFAILREG